MSDKKCSTTNTFIETIEPISKKIYWYLSKENATDEDIQNLVTYLKDQKIDQTKCYLSSIFHLLSQLSYQHFQSFYKFIDAIFLNFGSQILLLFKDTELVYIFKKNKRILLILLMLDIIKPNEKIFSILFTEKYMKMEYHLYFYPEFEEYLSKIVIVCDHLFQTNYNKFHKKRIKGENDNTICKLIRNDSIQEFIEYTNQEDISLTSQIFQSYYEANFFLIKNRPTLIEYAEFFGSIQIFKYLQNNDVELTPSLWIYSIHSNNMEMIHLLEENNVVPNSYLECFYESIKYHQNTIANYIQNLYLTPSEINQKEILIKAIKYYNFELIQKYWTDLNSIDLLLSANVVLIDILIKKTALDINKLFKYENNEISCLHFAIQINKLELINYFLSQLQIDVNVKSLISVGDNEKNEMTPLIFAIEKGNIEALKLLLNHPRIDINKKTIYQLDNMNIAEKTPLSLAIEKKNFDIIQILFSHSNLDANIMLKTTQNDEKNMIKIEEEMTAFHIALLNCNYPIVPFLLNQQGIDFNKKIIRKEYSKKLNDNEIYNKYYIKKEEECNIKSEIPFLSYIIRNQDIIHFAFIIKNQKIDLNAKEITVGYTNKLFVKNCNSNEKEGCKEGNKDSIETTEIQKNPENNEKEQIFNVFLKHNFQFLFLR